MVSLEDLISKPRKSAKSFAELLPWFTLVGPGLVLCNDGSLLAAFAYEGSDVEGKLDFEVDRRIDQLQTALKSLNDRITLWNIQERRFVTGYPSGDFSSPIAQAIDREWEKACTKQRNAGITQHMYLSFNFPNQSEAFLEAIKSELSENDGNLFRSLGGLIKRRLTETGAVARVRGQLAEMIVEFEKILEAFSGIVELNLGFTRLTEDDLLGELYSRANLASPKGPVRADVGSRYLNTALATDTVIRRHDQLEFQGTTKSTFVAALSTTGTPRHANSEDMDRLMSVDGEYVLVQCFRFVDDMVATKEIQDAELFYRSEVKSVMTRAFERLFDTESEKVNTGNLQLADDAQEALVELTATDISCGWYNMTLLALGGSQKEAENTADQLASNLRASGYKVIRERQGILSAVQASMPGNAKAISRWTLATTANVADLAPIRTISTGEKTHPFFSRILGHEVPPHCRFLTESGISYDYNTHETDLGHTAIIGGAGAGKTSLMTLLISMFQKYTPSQTFIFDKDYSLMMATVLLGGKHIDLGGKKSTKIGMNPVKTMLLADDDMRLRQWVEVLIVAGGSDVSAIEGQTIYTAIQGLRRSHPNSWRLSALYALISGVDLDLAAKLAPYVDRTDSDELGAGAYSAYFDNDEDNFELVRMVGMECGGILQTPQLASPFMDYAFYNIESRLDGTTPTLIYIEEAWYMLANPTFAEKMEDWLRTFRKKRAFVMFATQALDELAKLPNIGSFITNIPSQIFLPAVKASVHQQAHLYKEIFDVNDRQLEILSQAIPKRDYLLVKPNTTRLVTTKMPPLLIAINEATTQLAMRDALIAAALRGGPDWEMKFVKEVLNVSV